MSRGETSAKKIHGELDSPTGRPLKRKGINTATGHAPEERKAISNKQAKQPTKAGTTGASAWTRICQKEGCNEILSGYQKSRCKEHCGRCKREGCKMWIKNTTSGLCNTHHFSNARECEKEGCNKILRTTRQKIRCTEHKNLCRRKGCTKNIQDRSSGLCATHHRAAHTPLAKRKHDLKGSK